jgi:hypothetical protein
MSEFSKALKYLSDNACIRRDSAKFRRGREQLKAARDPLTLAERKCIEWMREKIQRITSDIWDASGGIVSTCMIDELERALRQTLGGHIDPMHHTLLNRLERELHDGYLTRGTFVKDGAELFRVAAFVRTTDGKSEWREPDIRGFQYRPSRTSGYRKKISTK